MSITVRSCPECGAIGRKHSRKCSARYSVTHESDTGQWTLYENGQQIGYSFSKDGMRAICKAASRTTGDWWRG